MLEKYNVQRIEKSEEDFRRKNYLLLFVGNCTNKKSI